jgi:1-deoxy-D-xylulose-5-phosphate synthase
MILDGINSPEDIKKLSLDELSELAVEIREFLIENVSRTGGHLASNLGVVELTLALHKEFNTPDDKIVWDVGHQAYVHKLICGRKNNFNSLRCIDGMSGFPKRCESPHDCFDTGHSSTSISAALGLARARDIKKETNKVLAVIGDGALTGGMAFEALNDAGHRKTDLIVVLNDNAMSIAKNVGGLSSYLTQIRSEPVYYKVKEDIEHILNKIPAIGKTALKAFDKARGSIKYFLLPGMIFEELGFNYYGPIDGHNIHELDKVFKKIQKIKGPVLVHVCTQKGKGYEYAENKPAKFHGIPPFIIETGESVNGTSLNYSKVFGENILKLAKENEDIVAITAAMPDGTGLGEFSKEFPERFFDVGIAEQHAVTFAAGLACNGMKPVFAVYSSFLQRAYDQILHDVSLQNLDVVFAIDRAGIVGEDGETHQGVYDLSFLSHMPNVTIMSPCDYQEFGLMMEYAIKKHKGPIAIRYPRGKGKSDLYKKEGIECGKSETVIKGKNITIAAIGNMVETAMETAEKLKEEKISVEVINIRFLKPLDTETLMKTIKKTKKIITLEDNITAGGLGSAVLAMINENDIKCKFKAIGLPDNPISHGSKKELYKKYGLDSDSIIKTIKEAGLV